MTSILNEMSSVAQDIIYCANNARCKGPTVHMRQMHVDVASNLYICYTVLCIALVLKTSVEYYTVKSMRDMGSFHCTEPRFISRGAAEGNTYGLQIMVTACTPK